jgi:3-oxoacyl-[acyl-carrier protein] reductase
VNSSEPGTRAKQVLDLANRIAIVTGASRGIGRGIALRLATQGAHVIAAARGDHARSVVDAITAAGKRAESISLDVTDSVAAGAVISEVIDRHGRIDILVNNAGIARDQLLLRMKREDWNAVLETNLTAAFTLTQAVVKPMIRQRFGRIICISSVVGQSGNAGQANYAASKAGLIAFVKSVALELASRGITANVVAPGMIETEMTQAIAERAREDWESKIPLRRFGTPEDIAAAVCFLASDEASYITGQVLAVNGGLYT